MGASGTSCVQENTVTMPDTAAVGEVSQVISLDTDIDEILASFGVSELVRAFPDFDRADTVGVAYTGETIQLTDWSKVWILTASEGFDQEEFISALKASPSTVIAEPNGVGVSFSSPRYPNDPYFKDGSQWGLWKPPQSSGPDADVNATWAWGDTTGSSSIRIGIIDDGFTGSVADLGSRVLSNNGAAQGSNHGYRVAGVVGAIANNNLGISGVDWNASLISRQGGGNYTDSTTIQAMRFVSDLNIWGARVINASWGLIDHTGAPRRNIFVDAAFKDHHARNGISVCAIGNDGVSGRDFFPANLDHGVIAVGAINRFNNRWSQSSTGPGLDLVAPGVDVITTDPSGAFLPDSGTSFAAPYVAGAASLLLAMRPTLNADDVAGILRITADDLTVGATHVGPDTLFGAGRVNIAQALNLLSSPNRFETGSIGFSQLTPSHVQDVGPTTVFSVPGLPNGVYNDIELYEVTAQY